jgi:hypothetical protein
MFSTQEEREAAENVKIGDPWLMHLWAGPSEPVTVTRVTKTLIICKRTDGNEHKFRFRRTDGRALDEHHTGWIIPATETNLKEREDRIKREAGVAELRSRLEVLRGMYRNFSVAKLEKLNACLEELGVKL